MVAPHEVGEHPVGRTSAAAQLAGVMWLHLSRCVKMFKFQSANIRFTNNTTFKRNVKIIVRYMDLRVIFGNKFFDVGETNNWVPQLDDLLVQSDWHLRVDYMHPLYQNISFTLDFIDSGLDTGKIHSLFNSSSSSSREMFFL